MDQVRIGKFIAKCRKEKNMTQAELAEKLNITDRAISKWETGKGMPDSSIMLDLCKELNITVNELLSGEMIKMENYDRKAEENFIKLQKEKEDSDKRLLFTETIIGTIITTLTMTGHIITTLYAATTTLLFLRSKAPCRKCSGKKHSSRISATA